MTYNYKYFQSNRKTMEVDFKNQKTVSNADSNNVSSSQQIWLRITDLLEYPFCRFLASCWCLLLQGESEKNFSNLFKWAEKLDKCFIFLDEIDSLATTRGWASHPDFTALAIVVKIRWIYKLAWRIWGFSLLGTIFCALCLQVNLYCLCTWAKKAPSQSTE